MWRKKEIMRKIQAEMEQNPVMALDTLVEKVPTDVSGKWVNKDELKPFAVEVANYILSRIKKNDSHI